VHGAFLSHILSDLASDLGSSITARAFAVDAYQLAEQAGHSELCAWAADSLAIAVMYSGRPGEVGQASSHYTADRSTAVLSQRHLAETPGHNRR
jgi:hypothetical protein